MLIDRVVVSDCLRTGLVVVAASRGEQRCWVWARRRIVKPAQVPDKQAATAAVVEIGKRWPSMSRGQSLGGLVVEAGFVVAD